MKCKVLTITIIIAGFVASLPDTVGRWFYVQRVLRETGVITEAAPQAQDFQWNGRLPQGQMLALQNINGDIQAEAASGDQIEVTARKTGRKSNPDEVRIEVKEREGGILICAIYPSRPGDEPNECGKRNNSYNNDVKVTFLVKVPAGVNFKASSVNGNVEVNNLRSNVKASTVNGDVSVSTTGEASASTVNGDVNVTLGRSESSEPLKYSTVNGDIVVNWGTGIDASFSASTVNGDISSDFTFDSYEGKHGPKSATGRIGNGGRQVKLSTVNGDIRLKGAAAKL